MRTVVMATMIFALALTAVCAAQDAKEDKPTQLVTALKHELLFERINFEYTWRGATNTGITYDNYITRRRSGKPLERDKPIRIMHIKIAVHPSTSVAHDMLKMRLAMNQMSPPKLGEAAAQHMGVDNIGDERYLFSGSALFRRDNVTIEVIGRFDAPYEVAKTIDELIQTDEKIAPRGTFSPTPAIVSHGLPTELPRDGTAVKRAEPVLAGFGDSGRLSIYPGPGKQDIAGQKNKAGEPVVSFHGFALQGDSQRQFVVIATNDDNLFVREVVNVQLTD